MKEEIRQLTNKEFLDFVMEVDEEFNPPLSHRLNLEEYVSKLYSLSDLFYEFSDNGLLSGVVAIYLYDCKNDKAFIPFVAVKKEKRGKGIAKRILLKAIKAARAKGKTEIGIATNNPVALHLYESLGFKKIDGNYDEIHHPQLIITL